MAKTPNVLSNKPREKKKTETDLRKERALLPVTHAGMTFDSKHHVFIAKLKRGELWALNHLSSPEKSAVTPLFEMSPPTIPRAAKAKPGQTPKPPKPPKSLAEHSKDLFQLVRDEWGQLPCFIDTQYVPKGGIPTAAAAQTIFSAARGLGVPAIPVTAIRYTQAYQAGIASIVAQDGLGAMIRLVSADFTNRSLLPNYLLALRTILKLEPEQIDLLVDLGQKSEQAEIIALGSTYLGALPDAKRWRTLTLAAGCFPSSISTWPRGQWILTPRSEWLGWQDIRASRAASGERQASFGDYGVRCGGAPLDAARRPDPNVRYTTTVSVMTRKGDKQDGQIKLICKDLIARPEYSGAAFSRGDQEIELRATASGSPNNGGAEQWIQWCTNHHLALTAAGIRNLPVI